MKQSAAILAGGTARRFNGRDKSALVVDGRTILDRLVTELASVVDDVLLVGGSPTHPATHPMPRRIDDLVPGCGPLGGLHTALTATGSGSVVLIACDMPYVTAPFIAYLLSLADTADIVVPHTERGYHPLCAVYSHSCLEAVTARLAERRLKMTDLLEDVRLRRVTPEEIERFGECRRLLANVNTPGEYADLETLQNHEP
jgi:molybdenum cofactor guanylyltransferase